MPRRRVRTHANPLAFKDQISAIDWAKAFPDFKGAFDLEIGFGKGDFIRDYALSFPARNVVGVELRKGMVENLQLELAGERIENLLLTQGEGLRFLTELVPPDALNRLFIFHPDPWLKTRHQKRRLINSSFLRVATEKMRVGGRVYVSTDVGDLWADIQDVFKGNEAFHSVEDDFFTTIYKTHWSHFSAQKNRESFRGVFERRLL